MKINIINGPNLRLIGKREVEIYGSLSLSEYLNSLCNVYKNVNLEVDFYNSESEIIEKIQSFLGVESHLIINAGGFSHTSIAIMDAIQAVNCHTVEVHISNVFKRENFRHKSYISAVADGIITGLGIKGYELAIEYLISKYENK